MFFANDPHEKCGPSRRGAWPSGWLGPWRENSPPGRLRAGWMLGPCAQLFEGGNDRREQSLIPIHWLVLISHIDHPDIVAGCVAFRDVTHQGEHTSERRRHGGK